MKYDMAVMIVLLVINSVVGEFSKLLGINILGFTVIKANFFTRAVPYLLAGRMVRKYEKHLLRLSNITLVSLMIMSLFCVSAEYYILKSIDVLEYKGHFIGNGFFVLFLFILLLKNPNLGKNSVLQKLGTKLSLAVYIIHKPVGFFINKFLHKIEVKPLIYARSVVIFIVTLFIALAYYKIKTNIQAKEKLKGAD